MLANTELKKEDKNKAYALFFSRIMRKETKIELIKYIIIIILVILFRTFFYTLIRVNGDSMNDTLYNGEIMILDRISYRFNDIKRFDIVVVKTDSSYLIKRVIGLPGEKLKYIDGNLYINNKFVKEDYLDYITEDFDISDKAIPDDCYFVMGDNRSNSADSRVYGCFKKERILGKTSLVLFPFSEAGKKE